jgi:hypothetical protein
VTTVFWGKTLLQKILVGKTGLFIIYADVYETPFRLF